METQQPHPEENLPRIVRVRFPVVQPHVTYVIIGILVLVQLYVNSLSLLPRNRFYWDYANIAALVAEGEYYRLLTSMFLHVGWTHLMFNCIALYAFGKDIEGLFGHVRFTLIYVLGGLAGSLASFTITQSSSVGASGAVFAVFGALVAYYYQNRALYGERAAQRLRELGFLAFINLAIGFVSNAPGSPVRIDNAAHIGGAAGGLLLAWFITPVFKIRREIIDGQESPYLVDTRQRNQWVFVPIAFAGAMLLVILWVASARAVG